MDDVARVAQWLKSARKGVAFTGAGISTESGIPDFRSPGGVWATNQPVEFEDFLRSADARFEYWRQKSIAHEDFASSRPNVGHTTLAAWERAGYLVGLVTQNIDGLHQLSGSTRVLELHGTAREVACLFCHVRFPADPWVEKFLREQQVPACPECGGLLKHATISFGQSLDEPTLNQAVQWSQNADVFLAIGSSLVVHPAAGLPQLACQSGSRLVIINRDPTPLDGRADIVINAAIGVTLAAINEALGDF